MTGIAMRLDSLWSRTRWAVSAVRARIYCREFLVICEARETGVPVAGPLSTRTATHDDLPDLSYFHSAKELAVFAQFLQQGNVGYLAYLDGRCIHRSWYVPGPATVREHWSVPTAISADEGFVHYCKTDESARGAGAFSAVLTRIASDHRERRVRMVIARDNRASRRAAAKAGWVEVEEVMYSVILGRRRRVGGRPVNPTA